MLAEAVVITRVMAPQIAEGMKAGWRQLDCLLDPENKSVTLSTR
jgi:hypothetical protein